VPKLGKLSAVFRTMRTVLIEPQALPQVPTALSMLALMLVLALLVLLALLALLMMLESLASVLWVPMQLVLVFA
jgi:hypothetical protein